MALGTVTDIIAGESFTVDLLAAAVTAANGIPTSTAGVDMNVLRKLGAVPGSIRVLVVSTAGSGTMICKVKVWARFGVTWAVAKWLNAAADIAETSADAIQYSEEVTGLEAADRLFFEVFSIGGTNTAIIGYAAVGRGSGI